MPLLPDARIFGQITQNRPQTKFCCPEKIVSVKQPIFSLSGRKEAEKSFFTIYREKPPADIQFLSFLHEFISNFLIIFDFSYWSK
jgi:hypothetical protein